MCRALVLCLLAVLSQCLESPREGFRFYESPVFGNCVSNPDGYSHCAKDERLFSEVLVHPAVLMHPFPRRVLVIGDETGASIREVLRYFTLKSIVSVPIYPDIAQLCKTHMPCSQYDDMLSIVTVVSSNVAQTLSEARSFDIIIYASPQSFAFMRSLRVDVQTLLASGGLLVAALGPIGYEENASWIPHFQALKSQFVHVYPFATFAPSSRALLGFAVGTLYDALANPVQSGARYIDTWLGRRILGQLHHYTGSFHVGLFVLPTWVEQRIAALPQNLGTPPVGTDKYRPYDVPFAFPSFVPKASWATWTADLFGCSKISNQVYVLQVFKMTLEAASLILLKAVQHQTVQLQNGTFVYHYAILLSEGTASIHLDLATLTVAASLTTFDDLAYPPEFFKYLMDELGCAYSVGHIQPRLSTPKPGSIDFYSWSIPARTSQVVLKAGAHGVGVYAVSDMKAGHVLHWDPYVDTELISRLEIAPPGYWSKVFHYSEQMSDYIFRQPLLSVEVKKNFIKNHTSMGMYLNHGCDPNLSYQDYDSIIVKRDVKKGEELFFDYAQTDASLGEGFKCKCGSPKCRGHVHGTDYRLPEVQKSIGTFWPHIQRLIHKEAREAGKEPTPAIYSAPCQQDPPLTMAQKALLDVNREDPLEEEEEEKEEKEQEEQ